MGRTRRNEKKELRPKKRKSYSSRATVKKTLEDWESKDWENLSTDIGEQNGSRNDSE
jgi:ribosomal protein S20